MNNIVSKHFRNRIILAVCIAIAVMLAAVFAAGCTPQTPPVEPTYRVEFFDGDKSLAVITGKAGDALTAPEPEQKQDMIFVGWCADKELTDTVRTLPSVIPECDAVFYAKYEQKPADKRAKIIYNFNLGAVTHSGIIEPSEGVVGETVELKDGREYYVGGYKFLGWTTERTYVFDTDKPFAPLAAGTKMQIADRDVTLYAQWAVAYYNVDEDVDDVVYVFEPLIGHGLGAAIYSSNGKADKLGFVSDELKDFLGYYEFDFMYDDGDVSGRLYADRTYEVITEVVGEEAGIYLYHDYIDLTNGGYVLALDGMGVAVYFEFLGDQLVVRTSGTYEFDDEYGDYEFTYETADGKNGVEYFALDPSPVLGTAFDGLFSFQGYESGTYMLYGNGELGDFILALNGYGYAELYFYDDAAEDFELFTIGTYLGTDDYEAYYGEWQFVGDDATNFKFILSVLNYNGEQTSIYIEYAEKYSGSFTAATGDGGLYLDGYGNAEYTVGGMTYIGECVVSNSGTLLTFAANIVNPDGTYESAGTMYFNLDFGTHKFSANTVGFGIDGDVLTGYVGSSVVVEIPDNVKTVNAEVFNYLKTDVSLVSVTIPASVTEIGARAFENNSTLRRAIFLSETPIDIDFSSENSPFRWPTGDFIIVVPESAVDAYKTAWSDCPYAIKGSVEVTRLPEFEVDENGVLLRYNKQPNSAELLDVTLPDEVTAIADNVFRGADYLRSIDLNNVTEIGETAFYGCVNLETVKFTNVTDIGDGAFSQCIELSSSGERNAIELPAVQSIGEGAFGGCVSLRRIELGADIAYIGDQAFKECHIYEADPPLFIVLTGAEVPEMGGKIGLGNIGFRIEVKDVTVAVKCYAADGWNSYCSHLYIPSGDEKGIYVSGAELIKLDGRAVYQSSAVWLYAIDGDKITFYEYDNETAAYSTFEGTIADGVITVQINGTGSVRTFRKAEGNVTYTDGKGNKLVCDPTAFDPENNAEADVTFNGQSLKMHVGYNTQTIKGYVGEHGYIYTVTIKFREETMTVEIKRDERMENIKAADDSVMNIHYSGSLIYVYGEFKIKVGTNEDGSDRFLAFSEGATIATQHGNTFTFTFKFLNTAYTITATVSSDGKTFEYTYTKN